MILLIWEQVPYTIKLYMLPTTDFSSNDLELLNRCHSHYSGEIHEDKKIDDALDWLYHKLQEYKPIYVGEDCNPKSLPILVKIDQIIVSGEL